MNMIFLSKVLPFLFATSNPSSLRTLDDSRVLAFASKPTFLQSTIEKSDVGSSVATTSSSTPEATSSRTSTHDVSPGRQIINDVQDIYRDLATGCVTKDYTPTIQFKYTSPPNERKDLRETLFTSTTVNDDIYDKIKDTHGGTKPILLYLPGLDGVGISGKGQFDELSETFEFWRMTIDQVDDRSSFTELTTAVATFINDIAMKDDRNREVILVGESFGGLLAPSVAMRVKAMMKKNGMDDDANSILKGMVLVNPATSFDQTQWSTFGPILASLRHIEQEEQNESSSFPSFPTPYSVIGGMALAATVPDSTQFQRIFSMFTDTRISTAEELTDLLATMRDGFGILADNLPAAVIEHRLAQWLPVGCDVVNPRLGKLDVPTLVIAGEEDNMLPTKKEGERLIQTMPDCTGIFLKGSGHFVLDDRFNLTEAIIDASFDPLNLRTDEGTYDPIVDWVPPTSDAIKSTVENRVKPLRMLTSPKFFSTNSDGIRKLGLGQVPKPEGPLLFVANHQLLGLDLGLIIAELIEERGINARGLAHPIVFGSGDGFGDGFGGGGGGDNQVTKRDKNGRISEPGTFQQFGAVMVTPRNYYRLMQTGQAGLLFPGGVREVFHGKDEAYELFWPEGKLDFVRIAAKFNATIVPISAIGAADSANILVDAPDMLKLPFGLGERAANTTQNVMAARYDQDASDELFQPPLVTPKLLPARHYFIFGKPFDTSHVDHKDMDECSELYAGVKGELRRGLDDLLEAREKDPYKDTARRIALEQLLGKPAPTFEVAELNK